MDEQRLRTTKGVFTAVIDSLDRDPAPSLVLSLAAVPSCDGGFQVQLCMSFETGMTYELIHNLVDDALRRGMAAGGTGGAIVPHPERN